MEDLAHDEHIGGRQWVLEEVARVEAHPLAQSKRPHVVLEDGANRRQIEPAPREMAMCEGHLHWQSPLRRPNVDERLVGAPRELLGNGDRRAYAAARHARQKAPQALWVTIQRGERILGSRDFALW